MQFLLLTAAVVMIACIVCQRISSRFGIPMLLAFILLGMFFGSDGIVKISFDNFAVAETICSVALIFIMFYGGFGTKWSRAKPVAVRAGLLSTLGVVLTAGLTGLFCYFVLKIGLWESFLIGSVISSTDAASVFSILRSKNLNLKYNTASLLELESGSNDPVSYMLTAVVLSLMNGSADGGKIVLMLFSQIVFGAGLGFVLAFAAVWILKKIRFDENGFDTILVFAFVLLSFALPSAVGGNGYLSAYLFGMVLGNKKLRNKKELVHFFDGVTGLMQMTVFFLLGLLCFPSELPKVVLPALGIALFITFVARPLSVFAVLSPFRCKFRQQVLVSFAGLRGAASIVFAITAMTGAAETANDVFHMVFFVVLFSILFQGSLLPLVSKKIGMIDPSGNVLKTFNDYTEEVPVQFVRFGIPEGHAWDGLPLREIAVPPETLIVQILRGGENITPDGATVVRQGDELVLSAKAPGKVDSSGLSEVPLDAGSEWVGKTVGEIDIDPGKLVVMILRGDGIVIPQGGTLLAENDILVINSGV